MPNTPNQLTANPDSNRDNPEVDGNLNYAPIDRMIEILNTWNKLPATRTGHPSLPGSRHGVLQATVDEGGIISVVNDNHILTIRHGTPLVVTEIVGPTYTDDGTRVEGDEYGVSVLDVKTKHDLEIDEAGRDAVVEAAINLAVSTFEPVVAELAQKEIDSLTAFIETMNR